MTRRRIDEDDWDDFEEVEEKEQKPGILTTSRILVGLAVAVVVVLVVARLSAEKPQYSEVTPRLIGLWTCQHPEFSDQYVEFRRDAIVFGTGGTGVVKNKVSGMNVEKMGGADRYTIFYRDMAGTELYKDILLDETGMVLRFTDSADTLWTRYEQ
jgi:hypothetical protein